VCEELGPPWWLLDFLADGNRGKSARLQRQQSAAGSRPQATKGVIGFLPAEPGSHQGARPPGARSWRCSGFNDWLPYPFESSF
jgi:hypothetical protein